MRLANGITIEKEETFGTLLFSALRREVREQNGDGTPSDVIRERTDDLKSRTQGRMIQVNSIARDAYRCAIMRTMPKSICGNPGR